MVGVVEKRYSSLRNQLDSLGYKEGFPLDALGLVDHLLTDLVKKNQTIGTLTHNYTRATQGLVEFRDGVDPFKKEILRLTDENSKLRLHLLKTEEEGQKLNNERRRRLVELENENVDLKLLVSQLMVRLEELGVESLQKTKELAIVHQKNLEGVVEESSVGEVVRLKRRKQRMEMNCSPLPLCPHCVRIRNSVEFGPDRNRDPKVLDYLKIADSRIECLQLLVRKCKEDKEELKEIIKALQQGLGHGPSQSGKGDGGHGTSSSESNLSLALKTAQLQLNILQRRNIQLEDQLKKSILTGTGNYWEGRKMSKERENQVLEGLTKAHGGAYPSIDQMTLEDKNKYLEAQLSHCCKEKAKLKYLLEACEGREGRHPSSPGGREVGEYSRFRRVSSRSGGGGAPRPIPSTTSTTQQGRKEQEEMEEFRNGEEVDVDDEEPMTNEMELQLPIIQVDSPRTIIQELEQREEDTGRDNESQSQIQSIPVQIQSKTLKTRTITSKPPRTNTVRKESSHSEVKDKGTNGRGIKSSSVSLPDTKKPPETKKPQRQGTQSLKFPASSPNIQRKGPPSQSTTQNPAMTLGKVGQGAKGSRGREDIGHQVDPVYEHQGKPLQNGTTKPGTGEESSREESRSGSSRIQGEITRPTSAELSDGIYPSSGIPDSENMDIVTIKSPPHFPSQGQDGQVPSERSWGRKDEEKERLQLEIKNREEEIQRLQRALGASEIQLSEREGVVREQESLLRSLRSQLEDLVEAQREGGQPAEPPPPSSHPPDLVHENRGLRQALKKVQDELLFYEQVLQDKDEELKEFKQREAPTRPTGITRLGSDHQPQPSTGEEGIGNTTKSTGSEYNELRGGRGTEEPQPPLRKSQEIGALTDPLTRRIPIPTPKENLLGAVRKSVGLVSHPRDNEMLDKETVRERLLEREILSLRSSVSGLDREKEALRDELGRREERLSQLESKLIQETTQVSHLEQKLRESQMEIRRSGEMEANQSRDLALLRRQLENSRRDLDQVTRDRDEGLRRLREVSSVQSLTQLDRQTLQSELEKKNGQVEELRGKIQRYIEEVRRIEEILESKEEENELLLAQYRSLRDEFSELENAQVSLERESDTVRLSTRLRDQENGSLRNQLTKQSSLISSYEEQIGRLSQEVSGLESKLSLVSQSGQNASADALTLHSSYLSLEKKLDSVQLDLANCLSNRKKLEGEAKDLHGRNFELERILSLESENRTRLQEILDTYKETKELQDGKIHQLIQENGHLEEQILKLMDRNEKMSGDMATLRLKCTEVMGELDRTKRDCETQKLERESAVEELKNLRHQLTTSSASMLMNSALYSRGTSSPGTSQLGPGRTGGEDGESTGTSTASPNRTWTGGQE